MQKDPINTAPIENFIKQVKAADNSRSNDIKMDIDSAKNLAFTLNSGTSLGQSRTRKYTPRQAFFATCIRKPFF